MGLGYVETVARHEQNAHSALSNNHSLTPRL